jgi:hypothetical protein
MSLRKLEILQWVGLLLGALVWTVQHVVGFGVTEAACSRGGMHWGISIDAWEATLMAAGAGCVLVAGLAAAAVVVRTREESFEDAPPPGRVRFLAIAAITANVIFLVIILLDGFASIFNIACRQG